MRTHVDRDLAVDVLVIGAGIPALQIARTLHPRYSVCVVSEPGVPYESYESAGRFSAGYAGNDVKRIEPARRAAGWWRQWAQARGVPHDPARSLHLVRRDDERVTTGRWREAGLASTPLRNDEVPPVLAGGRPLARRSVHATPDDLVMDPARVAAELRAGLEDRLVSATVQRARFITPRAVDVVELSLGGDDGEIVPLVPRFVVLASDAANASLLLKVGSAMKDRSRRRSAIEAARASQAVRRRPTIVVRGALPPLAVQIDDLTITTVPGTDRMVTWLVQLPVDDGDTVIGVDDLRFAPSLDPKMMAEGLDRLFELCPGLRSRVTQLRWSAFVARATEHPMVAGADPASVPRPSPAHLETLGMEALVAAWPSHLAYTLVVAETVAARVQAALGAPARDGGPWPTDLPRPHPDTTRARWQRPDLAGRTWVTFADELGYPVR